jgi:hypothetical protein
MKRLLAIAVLLFACAAHADAPPPTAPITTQQAGKQAGQQTAPDAHRAHLISVLRDMRNGGDITPQQYDEAVHWVNAAPCSGVGNTVPAAYRAQLAAALAEKGSTQPAHILGLLRDGGWMIVLTESHDSDDPFRFYSGDPVHGAKPVTSWSGGAAIFETDDIARWVKKYAPGIPARLADCFAWTVTVGE